MGTATTFDILRKTDYYGGLITPGIELLINSLSKNTAKLPIVEAQKKDKI